MFRNTVDVFLGRFLEMESPWLKPKELIRTRCEIHRLGVSPLLIGHLVKRRMEYWKR
jgi:hypothetical protein